MNLYQLKKKFRPGIRVTTTNSSDKEFFGENGKEVEEVKMGKFIKSRPFVYLKGFEYGYSPIMLVILDK